jgi:hypothetical protein
LQTTLKPIFEEALKVDIEIFNKRDPLYGKTCLHLALSKNLNSEFLKMTRRGCDYFISDIDELSCFEMLLNVENYEMLKQITDEGTECLIENKEKARMILERKLNQNPESEDLKDFQKLVTSKINGNAASSFDVFFY